MRKSLADIIVSCSCDSFDSSMVLNIEEEVLTPSPATKFEVSSQVASTFDDS
jgi:hypothetical protein